MMLRPKDIIRLCETYHLTPSKSYGQNYLISPGPIEKMIAAADIQTNDTVIEIGPGFGILTSALAHKAKKVIAFEIERKLQSYWAEKQPMYPNVEIVWGDFLRQWRRTVQPPSRYTVAANVPYQITSKIIRTFLESDPQPECLVIMVQKEVAMRICARPGEMSLLALSVQLFGEPKIIANIPKGNFWPVPKVDSAILRIVPRQSMDDVDEKRFFAIAKAGFANKRKQVWRNISAKTGVSPELVRQALADITGDEKVRAEDLSVAEWLELARRLR